MPIALTYFGIIIYRKNGEFHRAGGLPAVEHINGSRSYWENGKQHRAGGLPAVVWSDGSREYWENGIRVYK